ncbi:MAG: imidazolonepropionase [Actinomycetota bacterium]
MKADLVVTGASQVVTCDPKLGEGPLGVIERGAIAGSRGSVVWVGPGSALRDAVEIEAGAHEVDASGGAVLPGLVDCHTHLVFAGDRSAEFGARLRGATYDGGGIRTTVAATRAASDEELERLARERLGRFLEFGVTTVEAKSGYGLTPEHERRLLEIATRLDGPAEVVRTFMGAHVVPEDHAGDRDAYVSLVAEEMIRGLGNLAEFCDVWCDQAAFTPEQCRRILRAAHAEGLGIKVHAEQLSRSGGSVVAAEFGAVSAEHLEHANEEDAAALARSKVIGVLIPGASMMTGTPFAPARMLIERGVRVALSTDLNPGTSYSENLQLVVPLACIHLKMTPEEAVLGVTRHAAAALSREGVVGSLSPGSRADVLVLDAPSYLDLAYHYGVNLARVVLTGRGR